MGKLGDEVRRLREEVQAATESYTIPVHVRLLAKYMERNRAFAEGRELPAYTDEELRAKYESDLEVAAGEGVVGWLRGSAGWSRPEERRMLEIWEEQARRRVEAAQSLPLAEVYDVREGATDKLDDEFADIYDTMFHYSHELDDDRREQ